jgi:diguanylate cyclase (GGDEF)-like protein
MNRKYLLISILIFVLFFVVFSLFPNFLISQELKVHDGFFQFARSLGRSSLHKDKMVIIALDDPSFVKMERQWPLPRTVFADLLNIISKGNPKIVFFDIVFRGDSVDSKEDETFAQAIKGKNYLMFPYHMGTRAFHVRSKKTFTEETGSVGYINKILDSEGGIRRLNPFRLMIDDRIKDYCTEFYLFGKYYNYDIKGNVAIKDRVVYLNNFNIEGKEGSFGDRNFPLRSDSSVWINFQAAFNDFNVISMYKVFLDDFDTSVFKDKIVLIGNTSDIFHDIYRTPLGAMPGTAIIANTALMFLDGKFIHDPSDWIKWLFIFLFCMLIVFVCYRLPMLKGFLFTVSVVSIITALTFWLFLNNYYFNPFKVILICILSYVVLNFYKYASVVIENIDLRRISTTDELTGLNTFRFFSIVINHEFQKCLRYKMPLSLLMIDIDNFKKINDTYGHQKGNVVLNKIGKIIISNVRKADFPARYGGEEMAILLPISDIQGAQKCAEHIRQLIEQEDYFTTPLGPLKVTVSIGVSSYPSMNITSQEDMIRLADAALYKAKHEGKNRVVVYREGE